MAPFFLWEWIVLAWTPNYDGKSIIERNFQESRYCKMTGSSHVVYNASMNAATMLECDRVHCFTFVHHPYYRQKNNEGDAFYDGNYSVGNHFARTLSH